MQDITSSLGNWYSFRRGWSDSQEARDLKPDREKAQKWQVPFLKYRRLAGDLMMFVNLLPVQ